MIHWLVGRIGTQRLPLDLGLKHTYDYRVVWLDPRLIQRSLRVGEWAVADPLRDRRLARFRRWAYLGGGWKHLQHHASRNLHGRFIAGGDWDLQHQPFTIRQTIIDLFVKGLPPSQTLEYQKMLRWIESGQFAWTRGCMTAEDLEEYFQELTELYEAIRRDGYRTQVELGGSGADEIRVCIDRDGRPCVFGGGTHRLSIALLLGLERVPVVVKRVHPLWVRHCLETYAVDDVRQAIDRGFAVLEQASMDGSAFVHGEDLP